MQHNIFRAYDIRGIYPKEINEESSTLVAKAFSQLVKGKVVVGRDARVSGLRLQTAINKALSECGIQVLDVGMLPTPIINYWIAKTKARAGIIISASHNPSDYNGIRFRRRDGTGWVSCIQKVKDIVHNMDFGGMESEKGKIESIENEVVVDSYIDYLMSKVKLERKLKVVLDPGNGAACGIARMLFEKAGCNVTEINSVVDGNFPGRGPHPNAKVLTELKKKVVAKRADLGIAYDGDADRCVIVDEKGTVLDAEEMGIVIIREILKRGDKVALNVECSISVEDEVKKLKGKVIRIPVGDVYLADAAKKHGVIFALESSNHYLVKELFPFDDGIATSLYLAGLLSKGRRKLSSRVSGIPKYERMQKSFVCADEEKFKVVKKFAKSFPKKDVMTLDGAKVKFKDGWVLLRASNTQPLIRITIETKTRAGLKRVEERIRPILASLDLSL